MSFLLSTHPYVFVLLIYFLHITNCNSYCSIDFIYLFIFNTKTRHYNKNSMQLLYLLIN